MPVAPLHHAADYFAGYKVIVKGARGTLHHAADYDTINTGMKKYRPISLRAVKTYPLSMRKSKVKKGLSAKTHTKGASFHEFVSSLPGVLAASDIRAVAKAIIKARGASSAASAASAAINHMHDWVHSTPADDWVSMGIPADGSYGIKEGVIYSYPVRCSNGNYEIVQGLGISDFSRERMDATEAELREERAAIEDLL